MKKIPLIFRKFVILLPVMLMLCLVGCMSFGKEEAVEEKGLLETIEGYQGYVRTVGNEEYEFYTEIIRQQVSPDLTEAELEEEIKAYAEDVNAIFYLGNRLGLYESFSFDVLQMRLEQENEERRVKLENGEVVYGLQQYDLKSYLQYEMTNLELDIKNYILTNITEEELGEGPEQFYNENEEKFREVESITYEITMDGKTETIVSDQLDLRSMRNYEPVLLDFLTRSEVGDIYEEPELGSDKIFRTVKLTDIQYAPMGYENHVDNAIDAYMDEILLPKLLETVAAKNPLEYAQDE